MNVDLHVKQRVNQSARHVAGQRVSNNLRSTIYDLQSTSRLQGPQVIYSKRRQKRHNRLVELVNPVLLHVYAYEVILSRGDPTTR